MWSSHTYHEPSTPQLLVLTSYLTLLNIFGWLAQTLLSAGLLGQILIGIIYGTPLAGWLGVSEGWEETFVGLGYVGLLLVVFEGEFSSRCCRLGYV
jgi:Kef-type K+ transport system membrane component KefB